MKNREWLQSMAIYDLLKLIRLNVRDSVSPCLMEIVGQYTKDDVQANKSLRCDDYDSCDACLQAWLNEERK